jgi:hypothetical protein
MKTRTTNIGSASKILSSHIFPKNVVQTLSKRNEAQRSNVTKSNAILTRDSRAAFTSDVGFSTPVFAHYPFINREAMAKTMDNYRLFVYNYNQKVIK